MGSWSRKGPPGPKAIDRIVDWLLTPGPDGETRPWTVRELAQGTGAHSTTVWSALLHHEGDRVERAGVAPVEGGRGSGSVAALWRAR